MEVRPTPLNSVSDRGDYGHIVEVALIRDASGRVAVIEADNAAVNAKLRATMRAMSRIWSIDALGVHVEKLLAAVAAGKETTTTQASADKVAQVLAAAHAAAAHEIESCFKAAELEHLVHPLLERIYKGRVEHWGGPSEAGADLIVYVEDALGLESMVGVQVKCYQGIHEDLGALEQIKQARATHRIDAGVVITTAREVGTNFESHRKDLERELGIDIRVITRDELVDLVLQYMRPAPADA